MDRYLSAIASEEKKLSLLTARKNGLICANNIKRQAVEKCDAEVKKLNSEQDENLLRKEFLDNKKNYKKQFFKSSVKFSLKSSFFYLISILVISLLASSITPEIMDVIFGNITVAIMLGAVEYYNVSRCFRSVVNGYHGNVELDIETTSIKLRKVQDRRNVLKMEIGDNERLLAEVELAISEINSKILSYRTSRNSLIEALIEELDVHIDNFTYEESDIHKVLEKQIQ